MFLVRLSGVGILDLLLGRHIEPAGLGGIAHKAVKKHLQNNWQFILQRIRHAGTEPSAHYAIYEPEHAVSHRVEIWRFQGMGLIQRSKSFLHQRKIIK